MLAQSGEPSKEAAVFVSFAVAGLQRKERCALRGSCSLSLGIS